MGQLQVHLQRYSARIGLQYILPCVQDCSVLIGVYQGDLDMTSKNEQNNAQAQIVTDVIPAVDADTLDALFERPIEIVRETNGKSVSAAPAVTVEALQYEQGYTPLRVQVAQQLGTKSWQIVLYHVDTFRYKANELTNRAHATEQKYSKDDYTRAAKLLNSTATTLLPFSKLDPSIKTADISAAVKDRYSSCTLFLNSCNESQKDTATYLAVKFMWDAFEAKWQWLLHPEKYSKTVQNNS